MSAHEICKKATARAQRPPKKGGPCGFLHSYTHAHLLRNKTETRAEKMLLRGANAGTTTRNNGERRPFWAYVTSMCHKEGQTIARKRKFAINRKHLKFG